MTTAGLSPGTVGAIWQHAAMAHIGPLSPQEYVELRATAGWGSPPGSTVATALSRSLAVVVERDRDGALLGMARAVGDGVYALIVDVVVTPAAQGRGIGRRLVDALLADPSVADAQHVALFAAPDVVPFYELHGFEPQPGTYLRLPRPSDDASVEQMSTSPRRPAPE